MSSRGSHSNLDLTISSLIKQKAILTDCHILNFPHPDEHDFGRAISLKCIASQACFYDRS